LIIRVINFAKGRSTSYKLAPEVGAVGIVGAVGVVGVVGYKLAPAGGGVQATSLHQRGNCESGGYKLAIAGYKLQACTRGKTQIILECLGGGNTVIRKIY